MASPSFFDRLTSPRNRSPVLPLHNSPRRPPSEYDLDELDPRPDDALLNEELPRARLRKSLPAAAMRLSSPDSSGWNDRGSSAGSSSKLKPRAMFAGPPPPIASSTVLNRSKGPRENFLDQRQNGQASQSLIDAGRARVGSALFSPRVEHVSQGADSVWRGLRRRERALEGEVQQLLDLQAAGLLAGSGLGAVPGGSEVDEYSDAGSSTPTGTFYSTATSKSRMINSLYVPTRATPEGNVIPVRQPKRSRPPGLRSARNGLRRSMVALADLKVEEDAHVDEALTERREALGHLDKLSVRRDRVYAELRTLEEDEEEPLGMELRDLGATHDSLSQEIRLLEEKLVGMRNRRRWLRTKMDDVKNRREAGLSGYRGALKDVDSEVTAIMRHPPIDPLDLEVLDWTGDENADPTSAGGLEFMRLIPERRTADMAKTWWQGEISILESRRARIDADRQALEEGSVIWREVVDLVAGFESQLRKAMRAGAAASSSKGKEKLPSQADMIRAQLPGMDEVVAQLEHQMRVAEEKHWNLLICAIGAELEAFREAQDMLKGALESPEEGAGSAPSQSETSPKQIDTTEAPKNHPPDESDNEVPADLLVSAMEGPGLEAPESPEAGRAVQRGDSEDEVPPEFLTEHDEDQES